MIFLYLVRCYLPDAAVFIALSRVLQLIPVLQRGIGVHLKVEKDRERGCMQLTVPGDCHAILELNQYAFFPFLIFATSALRAVAAW